jgi:hypothetical protein
VQNLIAGHQCSSNMLRLGTAAAAVDNRLSAITRPSDIFLEEAIDILDETEKCFERLVVRGNWI